MLKSFFHTGFVVRDLEKSVAFYKDVLGLEVLGRYERRGEFIEKVLGFAGGHLEVAFLNMGDGHNLELIQYHVPPSGEPVVERNDLGASHLAFYVEGIEELYENYAGKGMRFINSPTPLLQNGKVVRKALYAQDPDGNWLEFVEIME